MPRRVTITLQGPPRRRKGKRAAPLKHRVVVESFTLGRFRRLVAAAAEKMMQVAVRHDGPVGWADWQAAMTPEDYDVLFATACPEAQPRSFFPSPRNTQALLLAVVDTNDVPRLMRSINLDPDRPRRSGSLDGDVVALCRRFSGLTPPVVFSWYMDEFLDACAGLNSLAEAESGIPFDGPACDPRTMAHMPGVEVSVH
jgi:hypothetical protein